MTDRGTIIIITITITIIAITITIIVITIIISCWNTFKTVGRAGYAGMWKALFHKGTSVGIRENPV